MSIKINDNIKNLLKSMSVENKISSVKKKIDSVLWIFAKYV